MLKSKSLRSTIKMNGQDTKNEENHGLHG
jgi:hypothetical protein